MGSFQMKVSSKRSAGLGDALHPIHADTALRRRQCIGSFSLESGWMHASNMYPFLLATIVASTDACLAKLHLGSFVSHTCHFCCMHHLQRTHHSEPRPVLLRRSGAACRAASAPPAQAAAPAG